MKKEIYLFCSAGMSTSLLADKMQKIAESYNLPIVVEAHSYSEIDKIISEKEPSCVLLGPQVKYMLEDITLKYGEKVPVDVIDSADYGAMNGEKVLKLAIKRIKEFKK